MTEADKLPLEEVLAGFADAAAGGITAQLEWMERAAVAVEAAELGEAGSRAALDLRAALGAIIVFARGQQTSRELVALHATVRMLMSRALYGVYGAMAGKYRQLADKGVERATCRELVELYQELQTAVAVGRPVEERISKRLAALRATLRQAPGR